MENDGFISYNIHIHMKGGYIMGFLDSFLGHVAANAINEANRETKKHNELCYQLSDYEIDLNNYLQSVNCGTVYNADWGCIDSGGISIEKRKMDTIRRKVEQYIQLGGNPQFIHDLDEIDDCIEKINYLKSKGYLDRQQEFEYQELYWVKNDIEREEEEKALQREQEIEEIIGSDINSLSGIEFEHVCQKLVQNMGFETETTKASGDGGIDLVAYNSQPLLSGKYIIQCKRYTGSVGEPIIRDLYGVVMSERANKGILMTTGYFTKSAITFADGKPIELIDGVKMHELLSSYGIKDFSDELEDEEEINITPKEVFLNNVMIEDDYEKYIDIIQELIITNDERKRAKFINWLVELTMGDFPEIVDFNEKLVIFKEIKKQIKEYVEGQRVEKSNLLSYLYQMTYVHLSILEGNFNEAQNMFEKLMEHKELQFSVIESIEPNCTQILYDNLAVFTWLCYTWYDLIQVALLVDDVNYKLYLTTPDLFYGLPILERGRLESTIEEFDSGIRTFGNRKYFADKLEGFNDIETVSYNEDLSLTHMFFMDSYGLDKYYQYTYEYGDSTDVAPDIHKIRLEGNKLVIDGVGEIKSIRQKISRWKKFPERE